MSLNQYTQFLTYIKTLGQADAFVNTITQGEFERIDLDKGNIFPLLHVQINQAGFTNGQVITFDVQIGCFNLRDHNNEVNNLTGIDKFWLQDNEVDNMNECLATLNRMWTIMYRDYNQNNITASENPTLEPVYFAGKNTYDGWILSFTVELPNTTLNLCS